MMQAAAKVGAFGGSCVCSPGGSRDFIRRWMQLGIELYAELQRTGAERLLQYLERRAWPALNDERYLSPKGRTHG